MTDEDMTSTVRHQNSLTEKLTEWFHAKALTMCRKGKPEKVLRHIQKSLLEELWEAEESFAAVFCVGRECIYLWRGNVNLYVLNSLFGKKHMEKLTALSEEIQYEYAETEDIGLLLCEASFEKIPQNVIKDCLAIESPEKEEKLKRNLTELCRNVGRYGVKEASAICLMIRET